MKNKKIKKQSGKVESISLDEVLAIMLGCDGDLETFGLEPEKIDYEQVFSELGKASNPDKR